MNIALRIIRSLLLSVWSLFRFSLNFDPVKEILKIRCHIYISMNKVNILRKIHAKMKSFAPTILHHGKKLNILSAADLLHHILRLTIWRLTIWHHLFLEFWLVNTWFFAHWHRQRAVTCLGNVRQLNIRRGKKLDFQMSHRQPHIQY